MDAYFWVSPFHSLLKVLPERKQLARLPGGRKLQRSPVGVQGAAALLGLDHNLSSSSQEMGAFDLSFKQADPQEAMLLSPWVPGSCPSPSQVQALHLQSWLL